MNETVEIHGDTGTVIFTGMNVSKMVDFSKYRPGQVVISPYLLGFEKPWEQEVDFNE